LEGGGRGLIYVVSLTLTRGTKVRTEYLLNLEPFRYTNPLGDSLLTCRSSGQEIHMSFTKPKGSFPYSQEPTANKDLMQVNNCETQNEPF
jgi:hypothetical protein